MTRRLVMVAALGLALAAPGSARAGVTHVVKHGESLSAIAADAYGSAWKWVYIAEANKLPGSSVRPGRRLKLPTARPYVVRHGDSLAGLAQRFLGSSDRYLFLAKLNGIADPRSLAPGSRILIPAVLRHQVLRGESLTGLARRFYRTRRAAKLLRTYNDLGAGRVSPGTVLFIPLLDRTTDATEVHANLAAGGAAARKAAEARAARARRVAAAAARRAAAKAAAARRERAAAAKAAAARRERAAAAKAAAAKAAAAKAAAAKAAAAKAAAAKAAAARRERAAAAKAAAAKVAREKRAAVARAATEQAARAKAAREKRAAAAMAAEAAAKAAPKTAPQAVETGPQAPADPVGTATALYHHGAYQKTVTTLRAFLAGHPEAAAEARARRLLAFALVALGRRGEALEQFQRLLALDPKTTLDPKRTSPKILQVFDQARHAGG